MLRWAEYAPVSETMVKLLTLPSVATGAASSYQVNVVSQLMKFTRWSKLQDCENVSMKSCDVW